jgi:hypothetical protein
VARTSSGATPRTTRARECVFAATGLPASYLGTATAGSGYALLGRDTGSTRAATEAAVVSSIGSFTATFFLSPGTN